MKSKKNLNKIDYDKLLIEHKDENPYVDLTKIIVDHAVNDYNYRPKLLKTKDHADFKKQKKSPPES